MQTLSNQKSDPTSVQLMAPSTANCQSWLNSCESQCPQSSLSTAVSLTVDSPREHCYKEKQSSHQPQDQDSSSTQSTGQSHLEVPSMEGAHPRKQSGYDEAYEKQIDSHMKSVLSLGTPDFVFPASQVDYGQTLARIPYPYPDTYFGGIYAPCGPQHVIHPPMVGIARVPLPIDPAGDEPIYVNPKQYRGILRRRESRAKLEAQNKLIKARKPYLHESRHLHALKRVRGSGGRFLNTKKSDQSDEPTSNDSHDGPDMALLKLGGNQLRSKARAETSNTGDSAASCSETTSLSSGYNTVQMSDIRFSSYPAHMNGSMLGEGGILYNGSQYRVPGIR